jgi:glycosyltransferase involved in cell wall biosynthesis
VIVNQWVPAAHRGDAVGDHARQARECFRAWGHESEIYAMAADDSLAAEIRSWDEPEARGGDVTILHFATASPMSASFGTVPGRRVLQYHNVTPARFFAPFDAGLAKVSATARAELAALAERVDLAVGVSEFNRQELESLGFQRTAVAPILLDTDRLRRAGRVPALEWVLQDGLTNILFVGRIAPNKRIEDHIRLAEHYKRYVDVAYRFIFVGRYDVVPGYYESIREMVSTYRMVPDRFWFTGPVPEAELAAYYRNAHAYVSLSEHEGFGVPLVEAMAMDVPVLAFAAAAVPETLGGAGVSFRPKDLEFAAELLGGLIYDEPFRAGVIEGQRTRVRDFARDRTEPALREMLEIVTA